MWSINQFYLQNHTCYISERDPQLLHAHDALTNVTPVSALVNCDILTTCSVKFSDLYCGTYHAMLQIASCSFLGLFRHFCVQNLVEISQSTLQILRTTVFKMLPAAILNFAGRHMTKYVYMLRCSIRQFWLWTLTFTSHRLTVSYFYGSEHLHVFQITWKSDMHFFEKSQRERGSLVKPVLAVS